jgi:hypothetical protein
MSQTVADTPIRTLEQIGVRQIFGLMPNFPHLELEKIGNYAMASVKEALLAVTGP